MATFEKRGGRWRARVRRGETDLSESFRTKAEAAAWAAQCEADINAGKLGKVADRSVAELLERYLDEVVEKKDGKRWEQIRLHSLLGRPLAAGTTRVPDDLSHVRLPDLGPEHIAAWRDRRLAKVSPGTVRREWNLLSAIFSRAIKEWRWLRVHPMRDVERPEAPPPRHRRISPEEIERINIACGDGVRTTQARVGLAFRFAIETAMRAGEICALRWEDVDTVKRVVKVVAIEQGARKTKSARTVPLSSAAVAIIESLAGIDPERVFALSTASVDALFRKAKARAMVTGLTFHDSRAEGLTRLSKKLDVMQLARVSGHKDLRILHSVYYREQAEDMVKLLD